jgi:2,4-dienoyl-CoA reductase-like NADH-dependent reductase (Old Yellow Enzyme family)/thioredoxin reductase/uncharacterized protein with FMN-binding domain
MDKSCTRRELVKAASTAGVLATLAVPGTVYAREQGAGVGAFGTYTSNQTTGYATVAVTCLFDGGLSDVSYEVIETSENDYFTPLADAVAEYCASVVAQGSPSGVDVISGASLCTKAIADGVDDCWLQARGLEAYRRPSPDSFGSLPVGGEAGCEAVFEPVQIGNLTLRNRIVKSAGSGPWSPDNYEGFNPVALEHFGAIADGGAAMIVLTNVFRGLGLMPDDVPAEGLTVEDGIAQGATLIDRIHRGGAYAAVQISYGSPVGDPEVNSLTVEDIQAYVAEVGAAAARLKQAGMDAVEIKAATQDGLNAFLSRRWNQREDEYGPQSIENRCRFLTQMIASIKESCGEDLPVLCLINGAEEYDYAPGSDPDCLNIEEVKQIARALVDAGADSIQIRVGAPGQEANCWAPDVNHFAYGHDGIDGFGHTFDYDVAFGGMQDGSHGGVGAFIPMVAAVKEAVSVPVGCAGFMDLRLAPEFINAAVADGLVDLVYMNRPLNVDPELPNKLKSGRREDILPCTHCFHCHDSISTSGANRASSACRVRAAWQNAYKANMPEGFEAVPTQEPRRIMVVGGGPAGMEAARVAAQRGHSVELYEAQALLGRTLSFAQGVKGPHESLEDYRAYLAGQLDTAGVSVELGVTVDAELVAEVAPDVVVLATGGVRPAGLLESRGSVAVIPFESATGCRCGENVAILGASLQATDMALRLQAMGKNVTLVHGGTFDRVDAQQSGWFQTYTRAQLTVNGVKVWNESTVLEVVENGVRIADGNGVEHVVECDTVVEGADVQADLALRDELADAGFEVYAVGDCADPWNIQRAVLNANLLARSL